MLSTNRRMRLPDTNRSASAKKLVSALCLVLLALAGYIWVWGESNSPSASAAAPPSRQPLAPADTPTSTPTPCPPNWTVVSSPNSGSSFNELNGVAVVSANDIWAVGDYTNSNIYQTLIEHWNGSPGRLSPAPASRPVAAFSGYLPFPPMMCGLWVPTPVTAATSDAHRALERQRLVGCLQPQPEPHP